MLPKQESCDGVTPPKVVSKKSVRGPDIVSVFICIYCEMEFNSFDYLRTHQLSCSCLPPSLDVITSPQRMTTAQSPPQMSPVYKTKVVLKDVKNKNVLMQYTKDSFVSRLGLVPKEKAKKLQHSQSMQPLHVDCEIIDLDPEPHKTPITPRTPKILLSQLSRENELLSPRSKRRFSFSEGAILSDRRNADSSYNEDDSDSVASSDYSDQRVHKSAVLLKIAICSPLGQRVQKYIDVEDLEVGALLPDHEKYCRTPVKSFFYERLRNRPEGYPISFRERKKAKYVHQYKFSYRQQHEFNRRFDTGLNRHSRVVKRSMKPCKVSLIRLTAKEIKKWKKPKKIPVCTLKPLSKADINKWICPGPLSSKPPVYPEGPALLYPKLTQLLGLKRHNVSPQSTGNFTAEQVLSEDESAEMDKQKAALYRCLLSEYDELSSVESDIDTSTDSDIEVVDDNFQTLSGSNSINSSNLRNIAKSEETDTCSSSIVTVVDEDISFITHESPKISEVTKTSTTSVSSNTASPVTRSKNIRNNNSILQQITRRTAKQQDVMEHEEIPASDACIKSLNFEQKFPSKVEPVGSSSTDKQPKVSLLKQNACSSQTKRIVASDDSKPNADKQWESSLQKYVTFYERKHCENTGELCAMPKLKSLLSAPKPGICDQVRNVHVSTPNRSVLPANIAHPFTALPKVSGENVCRNGESSIQSSVCSPTSSKLHAHLNNNMSYNDCSYAVRPQTRSAMPLKAAAIHGNQSPNWIDSIVIPAVNNEDLESMINEAVTPVLNTRRRSRRSVTPAASPIRPQSVTPAASPIRPQQNSVLSSSPYKRSLNGNSLTGGNCVKTPNRLLASIAPNQTELKQNGVLQGKLHTTVKQLANVGAVENRSPSKTQTSKHAYSGLYVHRTRQLCSTKLRSGKSIATPVRDQPNEEDDDVIFVGEIIAIDA